jgi:nucleoside-diphosphate-sugar epimerase
VYDESLIDTQPKGTHYERSKQEADRLAVAALDNGMDVVFLHPSGVYGRGPTGSPGINELIVKLKNKEVPLLLPGGLPLVFAEDVGKGHLLAEKNAPTGSRYILSASYHSLQEVAQMILSALLENRKTPPVMPLAVGQALAVLGEAWAGLTGIKPLIPKGQLHFMQWQARPDSAKAQRELKWRPTPAPEGIALTVKYLLPDIHR